MAEDEAGKDNMPKNNSWIINLFIGLTCAIAGAIVGAMATALIGYIVICYNDYRIDNQTKEDLKRIISYDVQVTLSDLNNFIKTHRREEMIENSKNPKWALNMTDYDTSVLDAYIHKISLLPKNQAKMILLFYKNLRIINEAKGILQNRNSSSKNRGEWANIICDSSVKAAERGEAIIKFCGGLYISQPDDSDSSNFSTGSSTTGIRE